MAELLRARQSPISIWSDPNCTHHGWSSGRLSLAAKQGWRVTLEWEGSERLRTDGRLPARAVVCRDTAAEAAGTGGVGTAGALAKKLSSPMSHITKENDLNVKYPSHVRVDKEIRERSPANRVGFCSQTTFQPLTCCRIRHKKKEVKLTSQLCTWVLKSNSLNLYPISTVSCSLCICDSYKQLPQGGALGQWGRLAGFENEKYFAYSCRIPELSFNWYVLPDSPQDL